MTQSARTLLLLLLLCLHSPAWGDDWQDLGDLSGQDDPKDPPAPFHPLFSMDLELWASANGPRATGRYDGQALSGAGPNLSLTTQDRASGKSGDVWFWSVTGRDLGLTSRQMTITGGQQGQWSAQFRYDETPSVQSHTAQSLYAAGGETLAWQKSVTIPASGQTNAALVPSLGSVDLQTHRQTAFAKASVVVAPRWRWSGSVKHQRKQGTKGQSLYWGANPATAALAGGGSVFFAETVDYQTNSLKTSLAYAAPRLSVETSYTMSVFQNDLSQHRLNNPYRTSLSSIGSSAHYSLPPDSQAHDMTLAAHWQINDSSRLSADLGYGVQLQNQAFLPTTSLSGYAQPERSSLDGMAQTHYAALAFSTQPAARTDLRLAYTVDGRQDLTDPMTIQTVAGDAAAGAEWVSTHPYQFQSQTAKAELGYRPATATRLKTVLTLADRQRSHQDVDHTSEISGLGQVSHSFESALTAFVSYGYGYRRASHFAGDEAAPYDQHRKFFQADRRRHQVKVGTSLALAPSVHVDLSAARTRDDYPKSTFGMQRSTGWVLSGDLSYQMGQRLTASAFYTYEQQRFDSASVCAAANATTCPEPRPWSWTNAVDDVVHTVGLDAKWQIIPDVLDMTGRYSLSHATTQTDLFANHMAAQSALEQWPAQRSILHMLGISTNLHLTPHASLRLSYAWDWLSASDWALDGWGATMGGLSDTNNMLTQGEDAPSYQRHLTTLGLHIRW